MANVANEIKRLKELKDEGIITEEEYQRKKDELIGNKPEPQKKVWYKTWWGILIVVCFFFIFIPYFVWTKTNWNKWVKIGITVLCGIIFIWAGFFNDSEKVVSEPKKEVVEKVQISPEEQAKIDEENLKERKEQEARMAEKQGTAQEVEEKEVVEEKKEWYQGGTLHSVTVSAWKKADSRNKLATVADWLAATDNLVKEKVKKTGNIDDFKPYAKELVICVDTAIDGIEEIDNQRIANIGSLCMVELGYVK